MSILLAILISTFLVSLLSFIGVLTLLIKEKLLEKILTFLVALSVGGLMGGAFLHLVPEAIEKYPSQKIFLYILIGFFLFFIIEKMLYWRHCHEGRCPVHTFAYMNLFGDGMHNFIDGLIIAVSFVVNIHLGVAATLAIALHEIPQEIGDFGVLIYGGFKRNKALLFNFLTAIMAIGGGIFGYYLSMFAEVATRFLLPFAAGGFIYVAASDLIPEIKKETNFKKSLLNVLVVIIGILIMQALKLISPK